MREAYIYSREWVKPEHMRERGSPAEEAAADVAAAAAKMTAAADQKEKKQKAAAVKADREAAAQAAEEARERVRIARVFGMLPEEICDAAELGDTATVEAWLETAESQGARSVAVDAREDTRGCTLLNIAW